MESLDLCACNSASLDHPLRQRASLLGHTALNSRDFELQWGPHGSCETGRVRASCPPRRQSMMCNQGGRLAGKKDRMPHKVCDVPAAVVRAEVIELNSTFPAFESGA
ncbi:uncharacterized [Tachysurus ichikawai]